MVFVLVPLKGLFKGDLDIGIEVDVDMDVNSNMAVAVNLVASFKMS